MKNILKVLLSAAFVSLTTWQGNSTPLIDLVKAGKITEVKNSLNNGADIDETDDQRNTSLHWATILGDLDMVKLLAEFDANPDTPNEMSLGSLDVALRAMRGVTTLLLSDLGVNLPKDGILWKAPTNYRDIFYFLQDYKKEFFRDTVTAKRFDFSRKS
ncbi:MAG: ankyrin repeat domain-containing protein [Holosporaceae bacterium]|jgi:ankyrin repeat protein|nr:ankyrin repeat domain-containing protein [Holosporaceae bacterium]